MSEKLIAAKSERLLSLDVFRGMTMAAMVLVNNPGTGRRVYTPLGHARWNGWTPTDLIFPFFLFIVGVAMTFSFKKRREQGQSRVRLFEQVCRRTVILFLLGLILAGFPRWRLIAPYIGMIVGLGFLFSHEPPFGWGETTKEKIHKTLGWVFLVGSVIFFILDFGHFQESNLRIPGVLQRIAVCYFFASIILFFSGVRGRIIWTVGLITVYWLIMKLVEAPAGFSAKVTGLEGLLNEWIDVKIFGSHLYGERPDPEGLLSTLPAIATALAGILCGDWLQSARDKREHLIGMFFAGNILLFVGICMHQGFAINKKIWSSSYVVFTAGMALHVLGMCFYLVDIKGLKKWAAPFLVFGVNPIFIYCASGLVAKMMWRTKLPLGEGATTIKGWLFENLFLSWLSPINASLAFALFYVLFWLLVMTPFYRKKIYIKI